MNSNLTWNLCLVFQSHENVTAGKSQRSCGSPDAKPTILTTDVKKECPAHCISHQQFGKNDVKINASNGNLDIIKHGNVFKVCNHKINFIKLFCISLKNSIQVHKLIFLTSSDGDTIWRFSNFMYLMSPLFCEKGGTLFKGGHYIREDII